MPLLIEIPLAMTPAIFLGVARELGMLVYYGYRSAAWDLTHSSSVCLPPCVYRLSLIRCNQSGRAVGMTLNDTSGCYLQCIMILLAVDVFWLFFFLPNEEPAVLSYALSTFPKY